MKILHIISSLKIGGAEHALCNLLQGMKQHGWQHHVAYFHDGPCKKIIQSLNIPTYHITGLIHRYDPYAYIRLKKLVQTIQPDVLHSSLWVANIVGRLLGKSCNIPVVCDLHGNCGHEGALRTYLNRLTAHIPYRTIAVSESVKASFCNDVISSISNPLKRNAALESLVVINNGIDADHLRAQALKKPLTRKEFGIPKDAFVIGSVGRFEPIKSYKLLIQSLALLKHKHPGNCHVALFLIGDGSEYTMLKKLSADLGITDNVIFTGARNDAYRFYPLFDCFALSSQSEGLSLALLEALSFGLPIVTTHNSLQHDVIAHEVNGLLTPPNNPQALMESLDRLYTTPRDRERMRQANNRLVDTNFNSKYMVEQYTQVLTTAAAHRYPN